MVAHLPLLVVVEVDEGNVEEVKLKSFEFVGEN